MAKTGWKGLNRDEKFLSPKELGLNGVEIELKFVKNLVACTKLREGAVTKDRGAESIMFFFLPVMSREDRVMSYF